MAWGPFFVITIPSACLGLVVMSALVLPGDPSDVRVVIGLLAFLAVTIGSALLIDWWVYRRGST